MIEVVALILEYGCVAEYGETMSEALRDEELAVVVLCQFNGYVLAVCRTALAYVYCYIEHRTAHAAHQLALCVWRTLEMKSAHNAVA